VQQHMLVISLMRSDYRSSSPTTRSIDPTATTASAKVPVNVVSARIAGWQADPIANLKINSLIAKLVL
jgi:hypothetical protein